MKEHPFNKEIFDQALVQTNSWNFELAVEKVLDIKQGAWTLERAQKAVENYKRYMAVTKALGGTQLVPNGDIDEIWHMHILDTRAYMKDCNELFGEYLHHYPYFGMIDEENKRQWLDAQSKSETFWAELFDETLYSANNGAQKCPQVCPCNIGETGYSDAGISPLKQVA